MGLVKELADEVINQIKAGEVVERPLSVVKELVENALDADAAEITVDIFDGGKSLVRVTDTGKGMEAADALLAVKRHATSKIVCLDDLEHIATFGFRGEALASIAAVSKFEMRTRRAEDAVGTLISLDEQSAQPIARPVASPPGTQIEVGELFFNTPVRQKFLKNTATEYSHIHDFLQAMAFAFPQVTWTLTHNRRRVFHYRQTADLASRARAIFSADWDQFVEIQFEKGSFSAAGFASAPGFAKNVPQYFLLFVNGRLVRDKVIRSGVLQAYSGLVMKGQIPSVVLFVQCDPSWVDVNAHPNKTEVRFRDSLVVQDLVCLALQATLRNFAQHKAFEPQAFKASDFASEGSPPPRSEAPFLQSPRLASVHVTDGPAFQGMAQKANDHLDTLGRAGRFAQPQRNDAFQGLARPVAPPSVKSLSEPIAPSCVVQETKRQELFEAQPALPQLVQRNSLQGLKYLGQFARLYLLFESQDTSVSSAGAQKNLQQQLWVVDQHAFHERILFEEYLRNSSLAKEGDDGVARQGLLTPHFFAIPAAVGPVLDEARDVFLRLGFEIEYVSLMNRVAIHSYPAFLQPSNLERVFDEVLVRVLGALDTRFESDHPLLSRAGLLRANWIEEGRNFSSLRSIDMYHLFYATVACHGAVRAGEELTAAQAEYLVARSRDVDFTAHCPHGRPVVRRFAVSDINNWFLRT